MKDARGLHEMPSYRIDLWHKDSIVETLAYIADLDIAKTAFASFAEKYKGEEVTLRQGARVIKDSGKMSEEATMPTPDRDWDLEEWLDGRLSAPVEAAILDRMAAGYDLHTEIYPALYQLCLGPSKI